VLNPDRLRAYSLPLARVIQAVKSANQESGGSVLELGEAEYMVRTRGYLKSLADFRGIPVGLGDGGTPVLLKVVALKDVARVQIGPEMRRGISELDGEGEAVGSIVIIFVLLCIIFRSAGEALLIMAAVPFALVGGLWLIWLPGYNLSVAVAVGFIALAGVAAEFGVVI
jgi:Cu/Ag efflux pump CusA